MEAHFIKLPNDALVPAAESDKELLSKIKTGQIVKLKLTRMRNYKFFKKWWALMDFAFDYWEPDEGSFNEWGVVPEKNFEAFRKEVTKIAGFHTATHKLNGDVQIEAKSIAWDKMDEDEFEKLYSACVDVILKHVCTQYDGEMLEQVVDQTMAFT